MVKVLSKEGKSGKRREENGRKPQTQTPMTAEPGGPHAWACEGKKEARERRSEGTESLSIPDWSLG
jgi:hypothetical protein